MLLSFQDQRSPAGGQPAPIPLASHVRADKSGYRIRLEQIGYDMYYGGQGAYLYQPIPKCACTTVKTLLLQKEGLPVDANCWRRHQKEYNRFPGIDHLTIPEQLDVFEGRTNTFKFVFVRNPYHRLASAFHDKLMVTQPEYIIREIKRSAVQHGIALSDPITFDDFVSIVSRQSLQEMNPHWRLQYYEGRFEVVKFDFIGRMEAMTSDLVYVLEQIRAPEALFNKVNERHNMTRSSSGLWETVSSEVRRQFLTTFDIDFDILHYPRRLAHLVP